MSESDQKIEQILDSDISEDLALAIVELTNFIWPSPNKSKVELAEELLQEARQGDSRDSSQRTRFVVWDEDRIVAHACVFIRQVSCKKDAFDILALAGVCTHPEHRGKGLGRHVVTRALDQLSNLDIPVCLFQTGVVSFYEKLNGRVVHNRFVNRSNLADPDANPWWDEAVMIVPATANWPNGTIDLGGPGY